MGEININEIINASQKLYIRTTRYFDDPSGNTHSAVFIFNQCMKAFNAKLPAEAITFSVFYAHPVSMPGTATIHRDGRLEMSVNHSSS